MYHMHRQLFSNPLHSNPKASLASVGLYMHVIANSCYFILKVKAGFLVNKHPLVLGLYEVSRVLEVTKFVDCIIWLFT